MSEQQQSQQPVSIKEWIFVLLISAIPLVNVVMIFVWAFGGKANKSIENWAKASLIIFLVSVALIFIVALVFGLFYQI